MESNLSPGQVLLISETVGLSKRKLHLFSRIEEDSVISSCLTHLLSQNDFDSAQLRSSNVDLSYVRCVYEISRVHPLLHFQGQPFQIQSHKQNRQLGCGMYCLSHDACLYQKQAWKGLSDCSLD